jgi:hypothetical protein
MGIVKEKSADTEPLYCPLPATLLVAENGPEVFDIQERNIILATAGNFAKL